MTHTEIKIVLKTVAWMLWLAMVAWFVLSYMDVLAYQNCGGTQNPMNLFLLFFGA